MDFPRLVKYAVCSQLISKQVLILIAEGLGRLAGIDKVGQFLKLVADVVGDQINADKTSRRKVVLVGHESANHNGRHRAKCIYTVDK